MLKSLEYKGLILSAARVEASDLNGAFYEVYLKGGSVREKDIFSNCVEEFFGVVDNQRYLLYRRHAGVGMMNISVCRKSLQSQGKMPFCFQSV